MARERAIDEGLDPDSREAQFRIRVILAEINEEASRASAHGDGRAAFAAPLSTVAKDGGQGAGRWDPRDQQGRETRLIWGDDDAVQDNEEGGDPVRRGEIGVLKRIVRKQGPPRSGLVPQSGDPEHPVRWVRPTSTSVPEAAMAQPEFIDDDRFGDNYPTVPADIADKMWIHFGEAEVSGVEAGRPMWLTSDPTFGDQYELEAKFSAKVKPQKAATIGDVRDAVEEVKRQTGFDAHAAVQADYGQDEVSAPADPVRYPQIREALEARGFDAVYYNEPGVELRDFETLVVWHPKTLAKMLSKDYYGNPIATPLLSAHGGEELEDDEVYDWETNSEDKANTRGGSHLSPPGRPSLTRMLYELLSKGMPLESAMTQVMARALKDGLAAAHRHGLDGLVDKAGFWSEFEGIMTAPMEAYAERAILRAASRHKRLGVKRDTLEQAAKREAARFTKRWYRYIRNTTANRMWDLKDVVGPELERGAAPLFGRSRAELIAGNEAARLNDIGNLMVYNLAGVAREFWHTQEDGKVDDICERLSGRVFPVGEGPRPVTGTHLKCRCERLPVIQVRKALFKQGPPGPPPRPNLRWKEETHRWVQTGGVHGMRERLGFWQDNPVVRGYRGAEEWLEQNPSTITARYSKIEMPATSLLALPGKSGEHLREPHQPAIDRWRSHIREHGTLLEPVQIEVDHEGRATVWEGNHRIKAAALEGLETIPTEVAYLGGSELLRGVFDPIGHGATLSKDQELVSSVGRGGVRIIRKQEIDCPPGLEPRAIIDRIGRHSHRCVVPSDGPGTEEPGNGESAGGEAEIEARALEALGFGSFQTSRAIKEWHAQNFAELGLTDKQAAGWKAWTKSSSTLMSGNMQRAFAEVMGEPGQYLEDVKDLEAAKKTRSTIDVPKLDPAYEAEYRGELVEGLKGSMAYERQFWADMGVTHIRVFRGIALMEDAPKEGFIKGDKHIMKDLPGSSWSIFSHVAEKFGELTVTMEIPVEEVLGSSFTTLGNAAEGEILAYSPSDGREVEVAKWSQ